MSSPSPNLPRRFPRGLVPPHTFEHARLIFWLLVVAVVVGRTALGHERTGALGAALLCGVLTITLWEAHLWKMRNEDGASFAARALGGIYALALWSALPVLLVAPMYADYTDRARVSELILAANPVKDEMRKRADSGVPLSQVGTGLQIPLQGRLTASLVASDGTITLASAEPAAVLMFTPLPNPPPGSANSGVTLRWTCLGKPTHMMVGYCR